MNQYHSSHSIREQIDKAENILRKKYEGFRENPASHSGYETEWKVFWKRRYKEVKAGNHFRIQIFSAVKLNIMIL